MARGTQGRKQASALTGEGYRLAEWLNRNLDRRTNLTNEELATRMGYARPNIISMWRTGRTRIPLDKLTQLADLLKVELIELLPLWLEQYSDAEGYRRIVAATGRLVSETEATFVNKVRRITDHRPFRLKPGVEVVMSQWIDVV